MPLFVSAPSDPETFAAPPRNGANDAAGVLAQIFGYEQFRPGQEEIIRHVTQGGDALVLMPTGGGKSLCYQIPALLRPGIAIVVSPLISLMKDQVDALVQAGVRAAQLNSSLSGLEATRIERAMVSGELDLVYVAPERLTTARFLDLLDQVEIALFAIDEAHCVSQWGHDFRPEYRALSVLHERFSWVPRIALTATADGPTRADIVRYLALEEARTFVSSFDRPNIRYRIVAKSDAKGQLQRFIQTEHPADAGIVYCLSRRKVEEVAAYLTRHGRPALPYHAGLDAQIRARHQDRFIKEEGLVIVATVAFGMGIDKPNVRFVAHLDAPKSLEGYYQETGRAGRDGLPADAWMTYGLGDVTALRQMLALSEAEERVKRIERQRLEALLAYCESSTCRRVVLLRYFGDAYEPPCNNCDVCLEPVDLWDATIVAQKALSAVYRTGQRFGVGHVVDVLMGKLTERVIQYAHNRIKTFGVGAELKRQEWQSVFRQLVARGLLSVDLEGHGGLELGPQAPAVIRGEVSVRMARENAAPARRSRPTPPGGAVSGDAAADPLWAALRRWRTDQAQTQGVPPYVIFHDATLAALVGERPGSLEALSRIPGVGRSKLDRYGSTLLGVIGAHPAQ